MGECRRGLTGSFAVEFSLTRAEFAVATQLAKSLFSCDKADLVLESLSISSVGAEPSVDDVSALLEVLPASRQIRLGGFGAPGVVALARWQYRTCILSVDFFERNGSLISCAELQELTNLERLHISAANNATPCGGLFRELRILELSRIASFRGLEAWLEDPRVYAPQLKSITVANIRPPADRGPIELDPQRWNEHGVALVVGDHVGIEGLPALKTAKEIDDLVSQAGGGSKHFEFPAHLVTSADRTHVKRLLEQSSELCEVDLMGVQGFGKPYFSKWIPEKFGTTAESLSLFCPVLSFESCVEVESFFRLLLNVPALRKISAISVDFTANDQVEQFGRWQMVASALAVELSIDGMPAARAAQIIYSPGTQTADCTIHDEHSLSLVRMLASVRPLAALNVVKAVDLDIQQLLTALRVKTVSISGAIRVAELVVCFDALVSGNIRALSLTAGQICPQGILRLSRFFASTTEWHRVQISEASWKLIRAIDATHATERPDFLNALTWSLPMREKP